MFKPKFEITPDLLNFVSQATELRSWIHQTVIDVAWLPVLQQDSAARLAHSSTSIEGNPLTLPEVEALARGENFAASENAKKEVLNYLSAMRWIWARKPAEPITEKELLDLHSLLMKGILEEVAIGAYKQKPNRVIDAREHTVYSPPSPEVSPSLTRELLEWIQDPKTLQLHPVITSSVAHHRLVSIHPFSDGNGRVARALAVWMLYTRGFDSHHLFALDEYFEQDRQRYYEKIQQARDLNDDLTYWLEYVAQGVVKTLEGTKERIHSLQIRRSGTKIFLTKRQEDLLRFLRDKGSVKSPEIGKAFQITRARVAQIIKPLIDAGLVRCEGRTRSTIYKLAQ